jgi:hypothetical protein
LSVRVRTYSAFFAGTISRGFAITGLRGRVGRPF